MITDSPRRNEYIVPLFPHTLTPGEFQPLGVERAAMNVLAAACIVEHLNDPELKERKALIVSTWKNLEYIYSMQQEDGGFRTIHATSLAISAEITKFNNVPTDPSLNYTYTEMDLNKARDWLVEAQSKFSNWLFSFFRLVCDVRVTSHDNLIYKLVCNAKGALS